MRLFRWSREVKSEKSGKQQVRAQPSSLAGAEWLEWPPERPAGPAVHVHSSRRLMIMMMMIKVIKVIIIIIIILKLGSEGQCVQPEPPNLNLPIS